MNKKLTTFAFIFALLTRPLWAAVLKSNPETFDFGWAPENAKISCDYVIKNSGANKILLQAVKPACGCTAARFSPMDLGSDLETKISLSFNTRGYKNMAFSKNATIETELPEENIKVYLKGHVTNPHAEFFPEGTGVASFEPGSKSSQKIVLKNISKNDFRLTTVYEPASWAKIKLSSNMLKAGQTVDVVVSASGPFSDMRETSLTLEANAEGFSSSRLTLAIRTGPAPKPYQPVRPSNKQMNPGPKNADGFNDPLKLKGVEPVNPQ